MSGAVRLHTTPEAILATKDLKVPDTGLQAHLYTMHATDNTYPDFLVGNRTTVTVVHISLHPSAED